MAEISTSILTVEKENAIKIFYNLETAKTDFYHIDVMDGKFVPKNTQELMIEYATTIKHISNIPLDVHFMVEDIKSNINRYLELDPYIITFHYEACMDKEEIKDLIKYLKENNIKVGLSVKPETNIKEIYEFLPSLYLCLIMTVEPGKGGQKLIPDTIDKIKDLKKYLQRNNLDTFIEADGGINKETVALVKDAGADILVAGSSIISSDNFKTAIEELK